MLSLPCTAYDRILLCLFLVFLTLFWAFLSFQIHPSTSDAYVMEQIAGQLDGYLSTLPTSGDFDADGIANCNYTYSVSASITTRTVNFAGVDTGVKYVAVALTKTVAEKG